MITIGAPMTADTRLKAFVTMGACMAFEITGNGKPLAGDITMTGGANPAVTVDGDTKRTDPKHARTKERIGLG